MSLINKMLQDLESRKNTEAETTPKKPVYEDLKPIGRIPPPHAPSRRLVPLLVLIAAFGGGAYAWTQWGDALVASFSPDATSIPPAPVVARRASSPKPAPAQSTAVPTQAPEPAPSSETPTAPPAESPLKVPLPQAAPPGVVEAREATSAPVAVAPAKLVTTETSKVATAKERGYWTVDRGETLYGISTQTGVDLGALSHWNGLGRHHVIRPGQKLRLTPPSSTSTKVEQTRVEENTVASVSKDKIANARAAIPVEKKPGAKSGSVSSDMAVMDKRIKPFAANEKAESEYRRAADLLQKGRLPDAEKHLRLALKIDETHTPGRELLAGVLLQQGHWREAQELLERGIDTVPAHYPFAQLLARVYVEHGADQKALAVMEGNRRYGAENPEYLAFLAALYQRGGKHAEAIKVYNEVLTLNPREGRWWLGMGISLEAIQDWNTAGNAYQRAVETGVLDDKLLAYVRQRLAVLKRQ